MASLSKLTDIQLLNAFNQATEIKLDAEFIKLLNVELLRRGIEVKKIS